MKQEALTTQRLIALRKLTREIADHIRGQLRMCLDTLSPAFRPASLLGGYVDGHAGSSVRGADRIFAAIQESFSAIAKVPPFNLRKDLRTPLEVLSSVPELSPLEYVHTAATKSEKKEVTVTSPLQWVVAYKDFSPARFKRMVDSRQGSPDEVSAFILHYLIMNAALTQNEGLRSILEALHYAVVTKTFAWAGDLPFTCIASHISTHLPPDSVIIESTEISGSDAFEEIVNLEDITHLKDPLRQRLIEIARAQGEKLGA